MGFAPYRNQSKTTSLSFYVSLIMQKEMVNSSRLSILLE